MRCVQHCAERVQDKPHTAAPAEGACGGGGMPVIDYFLPWTRTRQCKVSNALQARCRLVWC